MKMRSISACVFHYDVGIGPLRSARTSQRDRKDTFKKEVLQLFIKVFKNKKRLARRCAMKKSEFLIRQRLVASSVYVDNFMEQTALVLVVGCHQTLTS